jgi:transcriptional regulator with XRE-family HTH domain
MTISEKIKLLLGRRKKTITALAFELGISRQYMTTKLKEGRFTLSELQEIAKILDCTFDYGFIMNDTKEKL